MLERGEGEGVHNFQSHMEHEKLVSFFFFNRKKAMHMSNQVHPSLLYQSKRKNLMKPKEKKGPGAGLL